MSYVTGTGAVVPFNRDDLPSVREEYSEAIRTWCVNRQLSDALSREEIAALPKFDRVDAQRKALILNLIHYFRTHERADVAPGVAVIVHLLSDNDKGAATVSQAVMGKLFNRSPSSIADAHRRLKEAEIIVTSRGRYSASHPIIPRAVTQKSNHLAWLVTAAADATKPTNLPDSPENCQLSGQPGELKELSGQPHELAVVNSPVEDVSILRSAPMQLHYKNSVVVDRCARVVATGIATALGALPVAAHPVEPPGIHQPAKPSVHDLADKLFDAAGNAMNRTKPMLEVMEMPRNWIEAGADLERDILPTIRAMAKHKPDYSISSWKYFEQAIMDAQKARTAPVAEGRAPPGKRLAPWEVEALEKEQRVDDALAKLRRKYQAESTDG